MSKKMSLDAAYKVLELSSSCSEKDIKDAYRKLAMKHHPDRGGDQYKFSQLTEAKEVLTNRSKVNSGTINFNGREYSFDQYENLAKEYLKKTEQSYNEYLKHSNLLIKAWRLRVSIMVIYIIKTIMFDFNLFVWLITTSLLFWLFVKAEKIIKSYEKHFGRNE